MSARFLHLAALTWLLTACADDAVVAVADTGGQTAGAKADAGATTVGDTNPSDPSVDAAASGGSDVPADGAAAPATDATGLTDVALLDGNGLDVVDNDLSDAGTLTDAIADAADVALSDASSVGSDLSDATPPKDAQPDMGPDWNGLWLSEPIVCQPGAGKPGVFEEVTKQIGIDLVRPEFWPVGSPYEKQPVRQGGGTAAADYDLDGVVDFYFPLMTGPDRVYLSGGKGPMQYKGFDVPDAEWEQPSAAAADLDGDGDPDVITGGTPFLILRNDGPDPKTGIKFTDITADLGLVVPEPLYGISFADIDQDGKLDFMAAAHMAPDTDIGFNSTTWPPKLYPNRLYHATGPIQFEDVTDWLPPKIKPGPVFIASWLDVDNDLDQDLYIVYDFGDKFQTNVMLRNDGVSYGMVNFANISFSANVDFAMAGMGNAIGDFDRDGWLDMYPTGFNGKSYFLRNLSGKSFDDVTAETKTLEFDTKYVSWGALMFDAENDGWLDLYYANGFLPQMYESDCALNPSCPEDKKKWNPLAQPDAFYHNKGDGTFEDRSVSSNLGDPAATRSLILTDLQPDGFLDVIAGPITGAPRVWRNGCDDSSWLEVKLVGSKDNRNGISARVVAEAGGVKFVREIDSGSTGLWGSNEPMAHFGLGSAQKVDKLTVFWPSGQQQVFTDLPVRRIATITQVKPK